MTRLTWLQGIEVRDGEGADLGRVYEIRSPGRAETQPTWSEREIDCLLCGRLGLFERLGWTQRRPRTIPWRDVLALDRRELRVRGRRDDYPRRDGQ